MAKLTRLSFERDNTLYEVEIDFDDEKIVDDQIVFSIEAKVTPEGEPSHTETLTIELDWNEYTAKISLGDRVLHTFHFGELEVSIDSPEGSENIPGMNGGELDDRVYEAIDKEIGSDISELIDAMPVSDPIFGCLIKSGISSVVGQAIACNEMRNGYEGNNRFWQIVSCLRKHAGGIASRTIWRTARCIIRLGF